jgi:hypothetical protein
MAGTDSQRRFLWHRRELVRAIEPHTDADPAALLVRFLVAWGSLAGRGPHYLAEADRHHTNEYAVIVGTTSKGRKGTSWGRLLGVLKIIDEHWADVCLLDGLGSGEALIDSVNKEDKRRLVIESMKLLLGHCWCMLFGYRSQQDSEPAYGLVRSTYSSRRADSAKACTVRNSCRGTSAYWNRFRNDLCDEFVHESLCKIAVGDRSYFGKYFSKKIDFSYSRR